MAILIQTAHLHSAASQLASKAQKLSPNYEKTRTPRPSPLCSQPRLMPAWAQGGQTCGTAHLTPQPKNLCLVVCSPGLLFLHERAACLLQTLHLRNQENPTTSYCDGASTGLQGLGLNQMCAGNALGFARSL